MKISVIVNNLFMLFSIFYLIGCDNGNDSNPTQPDNKNNIIEITLLETFNRRAL